MKIVWKILCVICVLLGALGAISDLVEGSFSEDTALTVMVMLIFAGIFGYLAWIWRSKSPVKRAAEQMSNVAEAMKESNEAYKEMSKSIKTAGLGVTVLWESSLQHLVSGYVRLETGVHFGFLLGRLF